MPIAPKVKAASAGGATGFVIAWLAARGYHISPEIAAAIPAVLAAVAGWLKSDPQARATGATDATALEKGTGPKPAQKPPPRPPVKRHHPIPHPLSKHPHANTRGLWVWERRDAHNVVAWAREHGIGWIAVKVQEGASRFTTNPDNVIREYAAACRAAGIEFGVWGYLYGASVISEATLAVALKRQYGADFYIADVEKEYESNPNPISKIFTTHYRSLDPHGRAFISSFGRVDLHPGIDWWAWKNAGFDFMPQAYECDSSELTPTLCIAAATHIWNRNQMQVTVGAYAGARSWRPSSLHLRASVEGLGVAGANIWSAESASDADLEQIAAARL